MADTFDLTFMSHAGFLRSQVVNLLNWLRDRDI